MRIKNKKQKVFRLILAWMAFYFAFTPLLWVQAAASQTGFSDIAAYSKVINFRSFLGKPVWIPIPSDNPDKIPGGDLDYVIVYPPGLIRDQKTGKVTLGDLKTIFFASGKSISKTKQDEIQNKLEQTINSAFAGQDQILNELKDAISKPSALTPRQRSYLEGIYQIFNVVHAAETTGTTTGTSATNTSDISDQDIQTLLNSDDPKVKQMMMLLMLNLLMSQKAAEAGNLDKQTCLDKGGDWVNEQCDLSGATQNDNKDNSGNQSACEDSGGAWKTFTSSRSLCLTRCDMTDEKCQGSALSDFEESEGIIVSASDSGSIQGCKCSDGQCAGADNKCIDDKNKSNDKDQDNVPDGQDKCANSTPDGSGSVNMTASSPYYGCTCAQIQAMGGSQQQQTCPGGQCNGPYYTSYTQQPGTCNNGNVTPSQCVADNSGASNPAMAQQCYQQDQQNQANQASQQQSQNDQLAKLMQQLMGGGQQGGGQQGGGKQGGGQQGGKEQGGNPGSPGSPSPSSAAPPKVALQTKDEPTQYEFDGKKVTKEEYDKLIVGGLGPDQTPPAPQAPATPPSNPNEPYYPGKPADWGAVWDTLKGAGGRDVNNPNEPYYPGKPADWGAVWNSLKGSGSSNNADSTGAPTAGTGYTPQTTTASQVQSQNGGAKEWTDSVSRTVWPSFLTDSWNSIKSTFGGGNSADNSNERAIQNALNSGNIDQALADQFRKDLSSGGTLQVTNDGNLQVIKGIEENLNSDWKWYNPSTWDIYKSMQSEFSPAFQEAARREKEFVYGTATAEQASIAEKAQQAQVAAPQPQGITEWVSNKYQGSVDTYGRLEERVNQLADQYNQEAPLGLKNKWDSITGAVGGLFGSSNTPQLTANGVTTLDKSGNPTEYTSPSGNLTTDLKSGTSYINTGGKNMTPFSQNPDGSLNTYDPKTGKPAGQMNLDPSNPQVTLIDPKNGSQTVLSGQEAQNYINSSPFAQAVQQEAAAQQPQQSQGWWSQSSWNPSNWGSSSNTQSQQLTANGVTTLDKSGNPTGYTTPSGNLYTDLKTGNTYINTGDTRPTPFSQNPDGSLNVFDPKTGKPAGQMNLDPSNPQVTLIDPKNGSQTVLSGQEAQNYINSSPFAQAVQQEAAAQQPQQSQGWWSQSSWNPSNWGSSSNTQSQQLESNGVTTLDKNGIPTGYTTPSGNVYTDLKSGTSYINTAGEKNMTPFRQDPDGSLVVYDPKTGNMTGQMNLDPSNPQVTLIDPKNGSQTVLSGQEAQNYINNSPFAQAVQQELTPQQPQTSKSILDSFKVPLDEYGRATPTAPESQSSSVPPLSANGVTTLDKSGIPTGYTTPSGNVYTDLKSGTSYINTAGEKNMTPFRQDPDGSLVVYDPKTGNMTGQMNLDPSNPQVTLIDPKNGSQSVLSGLEAQNYINSSPFAQAVQQEVAAQQPQQASNSILDFFKVPLDDYGRVLPEGSQTQTPGSPTPGAPQSPVPPGTPGTPLPSGTQTQTGTGTGTGTGTNTDNFFSGDWKPGRDLTPQERADLNAAERMGQQGGSAADIGSFAQYKDFPQAGTGDETKVQDSGSGTSDDSDQTDTSSSTDTDTQPLTKPSVDSNGLGIPQWGQGQ